MRGTIPQAKPGRFTNSRKCVFFQGGRRTALEIAVTFACKVVFFGNFFRFLFAGKGVSRERRTFFEKDDFNAVYIPLG